MGEVYLADDTTLDRKVALKFLPEAFTSDPERMARFEREAKLLASLNHPNIAGFYGLEQAEGNRFLVLEYVEGKPTLASGINSGELLKRRVRIILSHKWKGSNLRRMRACTLLGALVVLPLGLSSVQSCNQDIVQTRQEEATISSSIPEGMRAISVKVDNVIGVAGIVLPGTRVDVIKTSTPPNGSEGDDSRIVLENVQVLTCGWSVQQNSDGQPQNVSVVTLLVNPEQAQKLMLAGTDGIQLAVRN